MPKELFTADSGGFWLEFGMKNSIILVTTNETFRDCGLTWNFYKFYPKSALSEISVSLVRRCSGQQGK
ncbi:hypothetical protein [Geitlerinema calcuttense]|uniref:hypothetical protein n=1 Tax=Geitlerinema calcuttense TaxID=1471433 RepID=UPI00255B592C|nr:hypothetical protein [Geitlerinema calcuttense]